VTPTEGPGVWAAGQGTFQWNNMNHKSPGQSPRHDRPALFHSNRPSPARLPAGPGVASGPACQRLAAPREGPRIIPRIGARQRPGAVGNSISESPRAAGEEALTTVRGSRRAIEHGDIARMESPRQAPSAGRCQKATKDRTDMPLNVKQPD
jgi:hypothetical protein